MRNHFLFLFFFVPVFISAQGISRKVLFLGNSYTYVNNLPALTAALAHSSGDSLFFDSNAPGGYTLGWQPTAHATDPVSLAKITSNDWDFVVLQEQSQAPAISVLRDSCMFPASIVLHDSVKSANPCSRVLFFLTWGRRFGGMQCFNPNYCSPAFTGFNQMQDSLTRSYKLVADSLSDWIAPAGEAWRFVISHTGMVLHDADNSHPNINGSYLAACVFYDVIFGKPSEGNTFTAGLDPDSALILQKAADSITFGYSVQWNLNNDVPHATFSLNTSGNTVFTQNFSTGSNNWLWDFGDGQTSTAFEPVHAYTAAGNYTVSLRACNACFCDSASRQATIILSGNSDYRLSGKIIMRGPGINGLITFENYSGDGSLSMYDVTGRMTGTVLVKAGEAMIGSIPGRTWIWLLKATDQRIIARGKSSR